MENCSHGHHWRSWVAMEFHAGVNVSQLQHSVLPVALCVACTPAALYDSHNTLLSFTSFLVSDGSYIWWRADLLTVTVKFMYESTAFIRVPRFSSRLPVPASPIRSRSERNVSPSKLHRFMSYVGFAPLTYHHDWLEQECSWNKNDFLD